MNADAYVTSKDENCDACCESLFDRVVQNRREEQRGGFARKKIRSVISKMIAHEKIRWELNPLLNGVWTTR